MRVIKTSFLYDDQLEEIIELENLVCEHDGIANRMWISNDINYDINIPSYIIVFQEGKIVGFMMLFMPDKELPEIQAIVHPDYRLRGYFTKMLRKAYTIFESEGINKCLLVLNRDSQSGERCLQHLDNNKLSFHHNEIRMYCTKTNKQDDYTLVFKRCNNTNCQDFSSLEKEIFKLDDANFVSSLLNNSNRVGYIAYYNDKPVGVVSINFKSDKTSWIYGLGVKEEYRGKGFGTQILCFAKEKGMERNPEVILDVESENSNALKIYQKAGFQSRYCLDYYLLKQ